MIDSHTHLHLCEPPDDELVAAAAAAGVTRILTVAIDDESCAAALAAAGAHPAVFASIGRHPNSADGFDLDRLAAFAADPRCLAIGETGLDYHHRSTSPDQQRRAFIGQIGLARELGKPLVIHSRDAEEDTLDLLRAHARGLRVLLHCFSMADRVEECVAEGWWISFAGNVTFPKASALAAAAELVPAGRLLVETDAPFLSPVPRRGRPNQPAGVVHTARFLADRRGVAYAQFEDEVERCAAELLGW